MSFIEEMLLNNLGVCILPEGILELLDNNLKPSILMNLL